MTLNLCIKKAKLQAHKAVLEVGTSINNVDCMEYIGVIRKQMWLIIPFSGHFLAIFRPRC